MGELEAVTHRKRIHLEVVEADEAIGFRIPHLGQGVSFRGRGAADYACGGCGTLIAIGIKPGMFSSLVLECACGALNRVPSWCGAS
jgi:hypothetical protein